MKQELTENETKERGKDGADILDRLRDRMVEEARDETLKLRRLKDERMIAGARLALEWLHQRAEKMNDLGEIERLRRSLKLADAEVDACNRQNQETRWGGSE